MKAWLTAVLVMLSVARADADSTETFRAFRFFETGDVITISGDIANLFDSDAYQSLDSGLVSTVVIRLWVYKKASVVPVAFTAIERSVVYDLWDDVYVVRLREGSRTRSVQVSYRAEALKLVTSLDGIGVARTRDIPLNDHFVLAVVAELNPVSAETINEVRRWLGQGSAGGRNVFGSFVSVFVNPRLPSADRVVRVRSQPFFRESRELAR